QGLALLSGDARRTARQVQTVDLAHEVEPSPCISPSGGRTYTYAMRVRCGLEDWAVCSAMSRMWRTVMRARACLVLVILVALCAVAAAQNAPKPLTVPMKWTPNEPPGAVPPIEVTGGGLYPLKIETAIDHREKDKAVGEHPDNKKPTVSVVSDSDIPGFFIEQVSALLKRFGVPLTTDASAKRILRMELLEFWVVDAQSYTGTALAR